MEFGKGYDDVIGWACILIFEDIEFCKILSARCINLENIVHYGIYGFELLLETTF
jgi:hypothetical protein